MDRTHRRRRAAVVGAVAVVVAVAVPLGASLVDGARPVRPVPAVVPQPPAAAPGTRVTAVPAAGSYPAVRVPAPAASGTGTPRGPGVSAGPAAPGSAAAAAAAAAGDPTTVWAREHAAAVGMDWRALRAYGRAQLAVRRAEPSCRVTWTTLAGIGWVETRNGTYGGAAVGADGVVRPRITGPALDGTGGFAAVPSTDGGRLDGDTTWDRAVGPMQFTPQTWRRYGVGDPSDYDAAALAAARKICARSAAGTTAGWERAVLSYNASNAYVADVWTAARWYAAQSG